MKHYLNIKEIKMAEENTEFTKQSQNEVFSKFQTKISNHKRLPKVTVSKF